MHPRTLDRPAPQPVRRAAAPAAPTPSAPSAAPRGPVPLLWIIVSAGLVATLAAAPAWAQVAAAERWQLQADQAAPWGPAQGTAPAGRLTLQLTPRGLQGPAPLNCAQVRHRFIRQPAAGWFEGQLPAPAEHSAQALGLPAQGLVTQRISCRNTSVDLHRQPDGPAWLALDNRVLQLRRHTPGKAPGRDTPEAAAQALLLHHFAGDLALSAAQLSVLAPRLTPALLHHLERWLAQAADAGNDEPPELNGDPFTNTQEPPDAFELAPARVQGRRATLGVSFFGPAQARSHLHLVLRQDGGRWRVDDVRYPDGVRLVQLLGR